MRNFRILKRYGLQVTTVSEAAIVEIQRLIWQCLKVVVEPSSAVAPAALRAAGAAGPVGVIPSGGNVLFPGGALR